MKKQNKSVKLLQRRKSDSHLKILSKSKSQKRENIISTNHQTHIIHNETDGLHIKNNNYVAKVVEKIPEPKNKEICYR